MPVLTEEVRTLITSHLKNSRPDLSDAQIAEIVRKIESNELGLGFMDPLSNTIYALAPPTKGQ